MRGLVGLATIALLTGVSSYAVAEPVVFDFRSEERIVYDNSAPLTLRHDGLEVAVTGHSTEGDRQINQSRFGVGVQGSSWENPETDGLGPDETARFTFNQEVDLLSVDFTRLGFNDSFTLTIDGSLVGALDLDPDQPFLQSIDFGYMTVDVSAFNLPSGLVFEFGVRGTFDDYAISRITVDLTDAVPTPEPATLALTAAGVLGFGAWSRRRNRRAKAKA